MERGSFLVMGACSPTLAATQFIVTAAPATMQFSQLHLVQMVMQFCIMIILMLTCEGNGCSSVRAKLLAKDW